MGGFGPSEAEQKAYARLTAAEKRDLNKLAGELYRMHGYEVDGEYDFSKATHPQERGMFRLALAAYRHFEPRLKKAGSRRKKRRANNDGVE